MSHGDPTGIWPSLRNVVRPEPVEQARYLLLLASPLILAGAIVLVVRRSPRVDARRLSFTVAGGQILTVGLLAYAFVAQWTLVYRGQRYSSGGVRDYHRVFFDARTLAVAIFIASLLFVLARSDPARRALAIARRSRPLAVTAALVAAAFTVVWLMLAVFSDVSIANALDGVGFHIQFTADEAWAVVNGRTPLVDFTTQYGSLWPYLEALSLTMFGKTLLVYTITMCVITGLAMAAIFDMLRRVVHSAVLALALYLPFVATSFFMVRGDAIERYTFGAYYGVFPLRYAGPFFVAWLTARQLERPSRLRIALLFVVAGLVTINNIDFGVAALGAAVGALLWTSPRLRPKPVLQVLAFAAAGLVAATALVSLLTLLRAGALPQFSRLTDYARLFSVTGFNLLPMSNVLGLHFVVFATYVATIGAATVRALKREPNDVLTGMLAWSGIFGLGSGAYYVGRSHPEVLVATFSAWALALVLLTVVAVQSLARSDGAWNERRPIGALAVLFAFGLVVCSVSQTPTPWTQVQRIGAQQTPAAGTYTDIPLPYLPTQAMRPFFGSVAYGPHFYYVPGAPVANLLTLGHRVSDAFDVVDVSRYTGLDSAMTVSRLNRVIADLRAAGGNTLFLPPATLPVARALSQRGFRMLTARGLIEVVTNAPIEGGIGATWAGQPVSKWVDTRNSYPPGFRSRLGAEVPTDEMSG